MNNPLFYVKEFWLSLKSCKETVTDFKQRSYMVRFSFYKCHYDINMTTENMGVRKHLSEADSSLKIRNHEIQS